MIKAISLTIVLVLVVVVVLLLLLVIAIVIIIVVEVLVVVVSNTDEIDTIIINKVTIYSYFTYRSSKFCMLLSLLQ